MKPSKVLLVSVFLTAVILAVVSGFASNAMAQSRTDAAAAAAASDPESAPTEDLAVYQEREAAYRQAIEQANAQLTAVQERLAQLEGQSAASSSAPGVAAPGTAAVSAEQALQAARAVVEPGMRENKAPELVSFEGKAAYEVAFEAGSVYVDAQSGSVLFNGTAPQEITADQAAKVASDYLGLTDILLVDQVTFRGQPTWRVIFKNSTIAYLDKFGQIIYVLQDSYQPVTVNASDDSGGDSSGGSFSGEHEHEHENEHEDD